MTNEPGLDRRISELEKALEEDRKLLSLCRTLINVHSQQINALLEAVFGDKNK